MFKKTKKDKIQKNINNMKKRNKRRFKLVPSRAAKILFYRTRIKTRNLIYK